MARPLRQSVELTVVPSRETFSGTTEIDLELGVATPLLWLNGRELKVKAARLTSGGKTSRPRVVPGGEDFIGFAFEKAVGPGLARLRIDYTGVVNRTDTQGLFAQRDGADWYLFSQFEPLDSRRAFPCFDEPSYKIPWSITLRVPRELIALSNAPERGTAPGASGMKVVSFSATPPMPSYLVAIAVGPFELVDVGKAGRNATPMRIVTPRGRGAEARWAAEATPILLAKLEEYFDTPYPYPKLDQVAIPITVFFSAMENPGLVTYGGTFLLRKREEEGAEFRRDLAWIAAHEFAHMWFGDLVTLAWWDDVWLNEAFASWMGTKVVDGWKPEWGARVESTRARGYAMREDSLATARQIRQPIESAHDVANAFDSITYTKGEAILNMFEAWIGEETFRKGVQAYLRRHAWSNAASSDFLAAISSAFGRDVGTPVSTFLEQSGVPMVTVKSACNAQPLQLLLSQKPYRPLGSRGAAPKAWQVPVCVRYGAEGQRQGRQCALVTRAAQELPLELGECPSWVQANEDAMGYYHVRYEGELQDRLLANARGLSVRERIAMLQDLAAASLSGDVKVSEALAVIPDLLEDPNRHVVAATASLLNAVAQGDVVSETMRPALARFVRRYYGERARTMGFAVQPGEDEEVRLLRKTVVELVALRGEDPVLGADALVLAKRWLDDPTVIDADMVEVVLTASARNGDRELFDRLRASARNEKQDQLRLERLMLAAGSFLEPRLVEEALALALDPAIDPRQSMRVLFVASREARTKAQAWTFLAQNIDAITARLPREARAFLPWVAGGFCDARSKSEVESVLTPRVEKAPGGPRNLAQVLEAIDLCIAYKDAQQADLARFLENR